MRFKQFISENKLSTIDDVRAAIHRDCKQYIKESDGLPLYRGIDAALDGPTFNPPVISRRPRDSGEEFNFLFDAGIDAAFGVKDIRKKTVFAGGYEAALNYGIDGFFFPRGNYKYVWSPEVRDSFIAAHAILKEVSMRVQDIMPNSEISKMSALELSGELNELIGLLNERMFASDWLRATGNSTDSLVKRSTLNEIDGFHDALRGALKEVFTKKYAASNLKSAISEHVEVLFYQTEGYYHVPVSWVQYQSFSSPVKVGKSQNELYSWLIGGNHAV